MGVKQRVKPLGFFHVRGVAGVRDDLFAERTAVGSVLLEHITGLAHHRLRGVYLVAGPAGNHPQLAQGAHIEQTHVAHNLVIGAPHPQDGGLAGCRKHLLHSIASVLG